MEILHCFKGYIYTRGIISISIINAPNGGGAREMNNLEKCNIFEYRGAFKLNLANCNKNN